MPPQPGVHVGVAGICLDNQGRVAMLQRSLNASHGAGKWSFPGGWIDYGEQPEDAMVREVHEEIGLTINPIPRLVDVVTNTHEAEHLHVVCLIFQCAVRRGVLTNMEPSKAETVKWFSHDEWKELGEEEDTLFAPVLSFYDTHGPGGIYL